jgi:hypothetical protein
LIARSKKKSWDELCNKLEVDPFGDAYKIVKGQMRTPNPRVSTPLADKIKAFEALFIAPQDTSLDHIPNEEWISEEQNFTEIEVKNAASRIKPRKSPGPDGIPPEAIKELMLQNPAYFSRVFSDLLKSGSFPMEWKAAKLILIEKPKKDPNEEKKYRPICLINVLAKAFETLLTDRLTSELEKSNAISECQFGFRKGKSTINAVDRIVKKAERSRDAGLGNVLVLVDVKNAFNSASWEKIATKLKRLRANTYLFNIIIDYLTNRQIEIDRKTRRKIGGGVPQGSVLGPTLWNILYDDVMRIRVPEGVELTCYADDLAVSVSAATARELVAKANSALFEVCLWMKRHSLEIAPQKTEAVVLYGNKSMQNIELEIENTKFKATKEVKYLGVILDHKLTFKRHIQCAIEKAQKLARALQGILPNTRGPKQGKRRTLAMAAQSIIMYAAPIWQKAVIKETYKDLLRKGQRIMTLRVCCAYRTISTEAALAIAGIIPANLLAEERGRLFRLAPPINDEVKTMERELTIRKWQEEWDTTTKGRWTHRLIKDLNKWISRRHGSVGFRMTQCMSGHGVFGTYLQKIQKAPTGGCMYCSSDADDAEHTLFVCSRWDQERGELAARLDSDISADNMVDQMLGSAESWSAIEAYMERMQMLFGEEISNCPQFLTK